METLLKADIFFVITSAAVIIIAIIAVIALVMLVMILNELRHLMRRIREEGESIVDDVSLIRETVENQGWRTKELIDALGRGAVRLFTFFATSGSSRKRDDE